MRAADQYDLIVIGDQIGGFFLATAAAQAGQRVLVVESNSISSAIFEVPSGNFLLDLLWEPVVGLAREGAADRFCHNLGLYQDMEELFPRVSPAVQMVEPKARIDYDYDQHWLHQEFEREYRYQGRRVRKFLGRLAGKETGNQRFRDVVAAAGLGTEWEQTADAHAALYGSVVPYAMQMHTYRSLVKRAALGVRYVRGGRSALKELLLGRLQVYGGRVKRATRVEEIVFERGRLAGVMLSSYEGFVRSRRVVGAMGANTLLRLMPDRYRPRALRRQVNEIEPRYWRYTFALRLPEHAVPEGLSTHVCFHDKENEFGEENFLQIFVLPHGTYSGLMPGETTLLVRALLPYSDETLAPAYLARLTQRALQRLETLIPFLAEERKSVVPRPERIQEDEVFRKFFLFPSKEFIPPSLLVYGRTLDPHFETGVSHDWSRFGLEGIYLCSRDVYPLYGLLGEMQTAMTLASQVTRP